MSGVATDRARPFAVPRAGWARVQHVARRAVHMELGVWRSVFRVVTARPRAPKGAVAFSYDRPIRGVLLALIVVSVVETVVVDLIVHPWPAVRWPLLLLGIWGVTFMLGMLLGHVTRPHTVGPNGIRVRHGAEVEIVLPWTVIASVAPCRRVLQDAKTFMITGEEEPMVLSQVMQDGTSIDIELESPIPVALPAGRLLVRELRISVDDPAEFLQAVRRFIP
jgi:hypothetical protein